MNSNMMDSISYYEFNNQIIERHLAINNKWKENHDYRIVILPGGITDIYGRTCDTITFDFKTQFHNR